MSLTHLPRFSDVADQPDVKDAAYYLRLTKYHPQHGHYLPMEVLEAMKGEAAFTQLNHAVFAVINERNAGVNEKYTSDKRDDAYTVDVTVLPAK